MYTNVFICLNCGMQGHKSIFCKKPIKSYGLIVYKKKDKLIRNKLIPQYIKQKIEHIKDYGENYAFLLVQRKDTMGYVDLMRGNFRNEDDPSLARFFREMTRDEHERILNDSFQKNSSSLWVSKDSKKYKNEYENTKRKINSLNIEKLISENKSLYEYPSFGFPKGRKKNVYESDIDCAIREFCEESGYNKHEINILDKNFFVTERFTGSDGIEYVQKYWIAECLTNKEPSIDENNPDQFGEIGSIGWFSVNEIDTIFYEEHIEKRRILLEANEYIVKQTKEEE